MSARLNWALAWPCPAAPRVPHHRLAVVLGHARAVVIHPAEAELGVGVALVGGAPAPRRGQLAVEGRAVAVVGGAAQVVLRGGVPDVGGAVIPNHRLARVFRDTLPGGVEDADDVEGRRVVLVGRALVPRCRLTVILRHVVAVFVHPAEGALTSPWCAAAAQVGETGAGPAGSPTGPRGDAGGAVAAAAPIVCRGLSRQRLHSPRRARRAWASSCRNSRCRLYGKVRIALAYPSRMRVALTCSPLASMTYRRMRP